MRTRAQLLVILAFYSGLALGYSFLMPMWEGPDEPAHYLIALRVTNVGEFPTYEQNYEALQPRLYYRMASAVLHALKRVDPELIEFYRPYPHFNNVFQPVRIFEWTPENYRVLWGAQILRWVNGALGGLALVLIYRGVRLLAPDEPAWALASTAYAGLLPQYLHISTSIGNDALAFLAGAALFWEGSRVVVGRAAAWERAAAVPAALILPAVSKASALPMGLALLVVVAWKASAWRRWRAIALGSLVLLAASAGLHLVAPEVFPSLWEEFRWRGLSFHDMAFERAYVVATTQRVVWSFWGKVGWLAVGLPLPIVLALTGAALIGLLGTLRLALSSEAINSDRAKWAVLASAALVLAFTALAGWWLAAAWAALFGAWHVVWERRSPASVVSRSAQVFLLLAVLLAGVVVTKNGLTTSLNQGRFFLPSIGPIAAAALLGWQALLPPRLAPYIAHGVVALMLALNLTLWFGGILPVYFQPYLG